jgi:hypothetical protein
MLALLAVWPDGQEHGVGTRHALISHFDCVKRLPAQLDVRG